MTQFTKGDQPISAGHILVVDDWKHNRQLLEDLLGTKAYEVSTAENGKDALEKCAAVSFDTILLDVMMPGMNGLDVCRQLKSDSHTAHVPVIIVTALTDRKDSLEGIESGADDFISKPIDGAEVLLRVRNAVRNKRLYDELQKNYRQLQDLEELRDRLTHMIVHDLRTPLHIINSALELIKIGNTDSHADDCSEELDIACHECWNMIEMVTMLLDVSRLESNQMPLKMSKCDLGAIIEEVTNELQKTSVDCCLTCQVSPNKSAIVTCDQSVIRRIIVNLLMNAIKFSLRDGEVHVSLTRNEDTVEVMVKDNGEGIPAEFHEKIFTKFGQAEIRQEKRIYSSGLGLTFCKLAVEAHGGEIRVESEVDKGSCFRFTLPFSAKDRT